MLTTTERLVRDICESKRLAIVADREAAMQALTHFEPSRVPKGVRQAAQRLRVLDQQRTALIARIAEAGWTVGSDGDIGLPYKVRKAKEQAIRQRAEVALRAVERLRQDAMIQVNGARGAPMREQLQALQKKVGEVRW